MFNTFTSFEVGYEMPTFHVPKKFPSYIFVSAHWLFFKKNSRVPSKKPLGWCSKHKLDLLSLPFLWRRNISCDSKAHSYTRLNLQQWQAASQGLTLCLLLLRSCV